MEEEPVFEIVPSGDESSYEAYHAVFSYILADPNAYGPLARVCGADCFISNSDIEDTLMTQNPNDEYEECGYDNVLDKNIVFNNGDEATHYKFYSGETKKIYDPYVYFQIPQSHGNCFGYALYLCSQMTQIPVLHEELFPHELCETLQFKTLSLSVARSKYFKIDKNIQRAYQVYVYNDWAIITDIVNIINRLPDVLGALNVIWNKLKPDERIKKDIPSNKDYTFAIFWQQFQKQLNIEQTYQMTWDVVTMWDEDDDKYRPLNRKVGIEGATNNKNSLINKMNYRLLKPCHSLRGGRGRGRGIGKSKKKSNNKKTKKKGTTNKNKNAKKTTYTHKYNTRSKSKSGKK